jgi:hypothetical protein
MGLSTGLEAAVLAITVVLLGLYGVCSPVGRGL